MNDFAAEMSRRAAAPQPMPPAIQAKLNETRDCECNNTADPCENCARVFAEARPYRYRGDGCE